MEEKNIEELETIPLNKKIDMIFNQMNPDQGKKKKKIKIPRKAKVRKGKLKKGWIGIIKVDENGNISGEKQKLSDSSIQTRDGIYHASDGREVLFWEGKYPVIIQPTWRVNPIKLKKGEESNETYGQKYIRARMLSDTIKVKNSSGKALIWIIGLAFAGYLAYSLFTGGF